MNERIRSRSRRIVRSAGVRRCFLAVWIVMAAALAGGCGGIVGPADGKGPLTASGTVRADEVRVASELGGRVLEVRASVGAEVRAGDVLVVLDAAPLLTKLAEAEAAVAAAQSDLAVVEAVPRVEEIAVLQAALALAVAQRDGALAAWENALEAIKKPQKLDAQIVEARTKVELAAQNVELAEAELARERLLRDQRPEGSVERQMADLQVRATEETLAAAQADERTAQTTLDWLWLIRSEPLALIAQAHAAEGQYRVAEASVAVAQADVLRVQRARFTLPSPVDGVVLDQAQCVGEVTAPAATILTVADLSQVTLMAYVPENQIGRVRLGQAVQVTVDSFPGQTFPGQVARIGDEPEFTPRNVATQEERLNTFYAVEVRLPNAEGLLKPGMPADVTF